MATLVTAYLDRVARSRERVAFLVPDGSAWTPRTWAEIDGQVRGFSLGLAALGAAAGGRCAIVSPTRPESCYAALGAICAGMAVTPVYASNTAEQTEAILQDCQADTLVVEDDQQWAKLRSLVRRLPAVRRIVQIAGAPPQEGAAREEVWSWARVISLGREADTRDGQAFSTAARRVRPGDLATIVYTSGTTGDPKGVELTHAAWVYTTQAIAKLGALSESDVTYLWLPLAHSFGMLMLLLQAEVGYTSAVDGRTDGLVARLKQVEPTFVCAVPRLLEKAHAHIVSTAARQPWLKRRLTAWALRLAVRVASRRRTGGIVRPSGLRYALADRLVFSRVRAAFGGRLRFFLCGGAHLNPDIAWFFEGVGIPVFEGYGSTETAAASFVNRPGACRIGTVGRPLPGTDVRFAEDGEILVKSPALMSRYCNNHGLTAETLPPDGWLRMGDIGRLDADGFLLLTERKKDLIKTAGGKYVAPQRLESRLKSLCPLLGHVVVHGEGRRFCSALLTLDLDAGRRWARERGIEGEDHAALARNERVRAEVGRAVDELNTQVAPHEAIRAFAILDQDLSLEAGELTPNAKLRRRAVETGHQARLDSLYERRAFEAPSDEEIARFLERAKTVAIVGLSVNPLRASYRVAAALKLAGFRIVPIHPTTGRVLGERSYPSLRELPIPVDVAVVFRRSQFAAGHIEEAVAAGIPAVWLQEGVVDDEACRGARARGLFVVADRCFWKTYRKTKHRLRRRPDPPGDPLRS